MHMPSVSKITYPQMTSLNVSLSTIPQISMTWPLHLALFGHPESMGTEKLLVFVCRVRKISQWSGHCFSSCYMVVYLITLIFMP